MYKILVSGASGFIGRALCRRILAEGWYIRSAIRSHGQGCILPPGVDVTLIEAIGPKTDWSSALQNIDTVVHLAARVHVMNDGAVDPLSECREVNVIGTERLAQIAVAKKVKRLVFMSSIKVNGEGKSVAYTESDKPAPQDPYGISKWEAEQVLNGIGSDSGMEVVILRSPLVYGKEVKANFLLLLKLVQSGFPLPLAKVSNQRSLIYLENLVDAIIACINNTQAKGTYLVSDGEDVSTPELIRRIAWALGKSPRLFPFPLYLIRLAGKLTRKTDAVNRLLHSLTIDNSKIQRELSWVAPYSMKQGLLETAKWYKTKCMKL